MNVECIGDAPVDVLAVTDEADNCTAAPVVTWLGDVSDGNTCPEVITRTYSVADDCNNTINVTQIITVNDLTSPVEDVASLPDATGGCSVTPSAPTATDNCDGLLTGTPDVSFPITALGTTLVTWTYTDGCGNTSTQTQNVIVTAVDVSTSLGADQITITATNSNGTYQWIDCNNGDTPIVGETNQSFVATVNGSYAVIITENGCTDTSACIIVDQIGISEIHVESLTVYPNPNSTGIFKYKTDNNVVAVQAFDMLGRKVSVSVNTVDKIINGSNLSQAKYMLEFTLEGNIVVRKEIIIIRD